MLGILYCVPHSFVWVLRMHLSR